MNERYGNPPIFSEDIMNLPQIMAIAAVAGIVLAQPDRAAARELRVLDPDALSALPHTTSPERIASRALLKLHDKVVVARITLPAGADIPPHAHPEGKVALVTVLSGEVEIGLGSTFDPAKLKRIPAGGMVVFSEDDPLHYARTGSSGAELLLIGAPRGAISSDLFIAP